jgi:hypothetical protein
MKAFYSSLLKSKKQLRFSQKDVIYKGILEICLVAVIVFQISLCNAESRDLPFPRKITGTHLQRTECVITETGSEEPFLPYIEEFIFTDKQAGISLYSCVNWREGFLKSEGIGKKQSKRAAELVARNNALKTLIMLNLNSTSTLQQYFDHQAQVRIKIQDVLIKNAKIQDLPVDSTKPDEAKVMVTIPFYGISGLVSFFLDDQEIYLQSPGRTSKTTTEVATTNQDLEGYTGILIDAREITTLEPALFPQIVSEQGEILYSASQVKKDILSNQGMIEYVTETGKKTAARSGEHPLIVKPILLATAITPGVVLDSGSLLAQAKSRKKPTEIIVQATGDVGQIPVNVVVSVEDAKKIKQLNDQQHFDQQGKYTILIGGKIGGTEGQFPDSIFASGTYYELERFSVHITLPNGGCY